MTVGDIARAVEILLVEDNPGDARLAQEGLREAHVANNLSVVGDGVGEIVGRGLFHLPQPNLLNRWICRA